MADALTDLKARLNDVTSLNQINALLDWDLQTQMPEGAAESRARHMSIMSRLIHEMFTADETGKLLDEAAVEAKGADYDGDDASTLRVARRDYDRLKKLPTDLLEEITRASALVNNGWAKPRPENDFKSNIATREPSTSI